MAVKIVALVLTLIVNAYSATPDVLCRKHFDKPDYYAVFDGIGNEDVWFVCYGGCPPDPGTPPEPCNFK